jgi:hypothetical protein
MATLDRTAAEAAIAQALHDYWDAPGPGAPAAAAAPGNAPDGYGGFAHELYTLLLRGGSDPQVERLLRAIEQEQLHRPELDGRDHTPVLRALRALERTM